MQEIAPGLIPGNPGIKKILKYKIVKQIGDSFLNFCKPISKHNTLYS